MPFKLLLQKVKAKVLQGEWFSLVGFRGLFLFGGRFRKQTNEKSTKPSLKQDAEKPQTGSAPYLPNPLYISLFTFAHI